MKKGAFYSISRSVIAFTSDVTHAFSRPQCLADLVRYIRGIQSVQSHGKSFSTFLTGFAERIKLLQVDISIYSGINVLKCMLSHYDTIQHSYMHTVLQHLEGKLY